MTGCCAAGRGGFERMLLLLVPVPYIHGGRRCCIRGRELKVRKSKLLWLILVALLLPLGCTKKLDRMTVPLHRAAEEGNLELVRSLIAGGAEINAKDDWDGGTPLHKATAQGHRDVAEILVANGADLEAKDDEGETPLHKTLLGGYKNVVELLLAKGADVNARGQFGWRPLDLAIWGDYLLYADRLLETKYGVTELRYTDGVSEELNQLREDLRIETVRLLISGGADINAQDDFGCTALHDAVFYDLPDIVKLLLESGANPNIRDKESGSTPLDKAISDGYADIVELLLLYGADANARDRNGQTPLHEAAWENQGDIAELLIAKGANVNATDRNGDTPAHVAALNEHRGLYELLIAKGANANAKNKQGKTPAGYANSPAPKDAVILSEQDARPYSAIITNLKAIRRFLKAQGIGFNQIWIPGKQDVEGLESALRSYLEKRTPIKTRTGLNYEYILSKFDEYDREYAGFFEKGTRYVICNMVFIAFGGDPLQNKLTTGIYDGGYGCVRVVFNAVSKKVVRIEYG